MPPLFTTQKKIKIIEYGPHANDDISMEDVKNFFGKILNLKAAKAAKTNKTAK